MKKTIILIFMILNFMNCSSNHLKSNKLVFVMEISENKIQDIKNVYPVKITIQNNSSISFDFWLMSCSFENNFIFSDSIIKFYNQDCDKNIPKLINLKVGEKYVLYGNLEVLDFNKLKRKNDLEVGFILIKGDDYNMFSKPFYSLNHYIFNMRKENNYMWYNVIIKFR